VFGAVAAAKLLKLSPLQTAHAIAVAGSNAPVASVMKTVYGARPSMAKNNFGTAAQVGVNAALLARRGFDGPLDLFEGETGFWRMFGAEACDRAALVGGLGERYEIGNVGFKPYSCCRIIQSSVEAAVDVFATAGVDARRDPVDGLTVFAPPIVCRAPFDNPRPDTLSAAQFSAPFAIAMALAQVEPGPAWFTPHWFADPGIHRLLDLVALRPLAEAGRAGHGDHAAAAQLVLADGRTFRSQVDVARGEAARPLSIEFLRAKFARLAASRLGAVGATELLATIEAIEALDCVDALAAKLLPGMDSD
jgi:2-methylcitrate dehydratase PrpD